MPGARGARDRILGLWHGTHTHSTVYERVHIRMRSVSGTFISCYEYLLTIGVTDHVFCGMELCPRPPDLQREQILVSCLSHIGNVPAR